MNRIQRMFFKEIIEKIILLQVIRTKFYYFADDGI